MSKILVSLADRDEQEKIASALRLKKHAVSVPDTPLGPDNHKASVQTILDAKVDVAILDYLADDAASVKILQTATDHAHAPRFIFILPDDAPQSHILMAVNEGADAVLQKPVNTEALGNYVDRAVNGPGRFRYELGREHLNTSEVAEMEKSAKTMQTQLAAQRKLIAYLLSTPTASQHRSVLIVSDSAYQRDYLKKLLEDHGFHVQLAENPEVGAEIALAEKPRIIISDLEMEGKNGVEFCHDLKINHKLIPCYFVICTANSEKADSVMAPGNGVDACVIKPSSESGNNELIAQAAMGLLL